MKHQDTTDHLFPFQQGVQRETWGRLPVSLSCRRGEESCLGTGYLPQSLPSPSPGCKLELPGAPSSPASWQQLPLLRSSARAMSSVARQHPAPGPAVPSLSPCQRLSCPAGATNVSSSNGLPDWGTMQIVKICLTAVSQLRSTEEYASFYCHEKLF